MNTPHDVEGLQLASMTLHENWAIYQALFPPAQTKLAYRPATNEHLEYWYVQARGGYLTAGEIN